MAVERLRSVLALVLISMVLLVPIFTIFSSSADVMIVLITYAVFGLVVGFSVYNFIVYKFNVYHNPLKIVDGRYGLSGAWISSSPFDFGINIGSVFNSNSHNNLLSVVSNGC